MTYREVKVRVNNKDIVVYLSPSKETDIFNGGNSPYADFQLIEGKRYYFEIDNTDYYLDGDPQIIKAYKSRAGVSNGEIFTGNYVGTFSADIKHKSTNERVGVFNIDIRSIKIGYESDYKTMMENITEFCTDLLMQQSSPVTSRYCVDAEADAQTEYERFAFVKSLVESSTLEESLLRIESQPITKWENFETNRPIQSVRSLKNREVRQLVTSRQRLQLPLESPVRNIIDSVPGAIRVQSLKDTVDVPENRFVKFVLNSFLGFCSSIRQNKYAKERLRTEAEEVCQLLFTHLANPLFQRVGNMTTLPLGSPVLQKRSGYREILQKWLMFDMAAKLSWEGGEDVYSAGQKNVARLYEYWLFIKLLKFFSQKFSIPHVEQNKLLQKTEGNLGLSLKEGKTQVLKGRFSSKGRTLNVAFAYNRTFQQTKDYSSPGSWSRQMRPDYTLSIWPGDIENPNEAERLDLITHIHFDAKYRVENLVEEFTRNSDEDLISIKHEEEMGCYKRADLLKMHAYKDAIKRSAGAYVLYPGLENGNAKRIEPFVNFHEIIPGLGAFAISPQNPNLKHFSKFIDDVIENFLNRTSQRERMQHHRYKDLQIPQARIFADLPEPHNCDRVLPEESTVLVGYTRQENWGWVNEKLLYPVRIGYGVNGSIKLDKDVISSQYVLLHSKCGQRLFMVDAHKGVNVVSKQDLLEPHLGYHNPRHDHYMLFHLKAIDSYLSGALFNLEKLGRNEYRSKKVFTVSLSELIEKTDIGKS